MKMSRSCARLKRPWIVFSEPKWMCLPSVLFLPVSPKSIQPKNHELKLPGMPETPVALATSSTLKLRKVAAWRGIRVLAWDGGVLYGSRGYQIVCLRVSPQNVSQRNVRPPIENAAEWEAV